MEVNQAKSKSNVPVVHARRYTKALTCQIIWNVHKQPVLDDAYWEKQTWSISRVTARDGRPVAFYMTVNVICLWSWRDSNSLWCHSRWVFFKYFIRLQAQGDRWDTWYCCCCTSVPWGGASARDREDKDGRLFWLVLFTAADRSGRTQTGDEATNERKTVWDLWLENSDTKGSRRLIA